MNTSSSSNPNMPKISLPLANILVHASFPNFPYHKIYSLQILLFSATQVCDGLKHNSHYGPLFTSSDFPSILSHLADFHFLASVRIGG